MGKNRGKVAYLQVDVGSSVFKDLRAYTDYSRTQSKAEIDARHSDSNSWIEYIGGDKDVKISVTVNYDGASTQQALYNAWLTSANVAVKYGMKKYTDCYLATATVTSCTVTNSSDAIQNMKFELNISNPATSTTSANLDTAGALGVNRGRRAAIMVKSTATGTATTGTKLVTLTGLTGAVFKAGARVMFTGTNQVFTIASIAGNVLTLDKNLSVALTAASIYCEIENITQWTFNGTQEPIDATDVLSGSYKEYLAGDSAATIDGTFNYEAMNIQDLLLQNFYDSSSTDIDARFIFANATSEKWYATTINVPKCDLPANPNQVLQSSFTLRLRTIPTGTSITL